MQEPKETKTIDKIDKQMRQTSHIVACMYASETAPSVLADKWRILATGLEVSTSDRHKFMVDYRCKHRDLPTLIRGIVADWWFRNGSEASIPKLRSVLCQCSMLDIAYCLQPLEAFTIVGTNECKTEAEPVKKDCVTKCSSVEISGFLPGTIVISLFTSATASTFLKTKWMLLAVSLDVRSDIIFKLYDDLDHAKMKLMDVLEWIIADWGARNACQATVERLAKVLNQLGMVDMDKGLNNLRRNSRFEETGEFSGSIITAKPIKSSDFSPAQIVEILHENVITRNHLAANWSLIAMHLDVGLAAKINLRDDMWNNRKTFENVVKWIITDWCTRLGPSATVERLVQILLKTGLPENADGLADVVSELQGIIVRNM